MIQGMRKVSTAISWNPAAAVSHQRSRISASTQMTARTATSTPATPYRQFW